MGRAVVGVVNYNGKVLIGKKKSDSPKFLAGEWHVPGESVEGDESDEVALKRGMMEEARIKIKVGKFLGSHITPTSQKEAKWYECFADSGEVVCGSDLEDIKWVSKSEVADVCGERVKDYWPQDIKDYFGERGDR